MKTLTNLRKKVETGVDWAPGYTWYITTKLKKSK